MKSESGLGTRLIKNFIHSSPVQWSPPLTATVPLKGPWYRTWFCQYCWALGLRKSGNAVIPGHTLPVKTLPLWSCVKNISHDVYYFCCKFNLLLPTLIKISSCTPSSYGLYPVSIFIPGSVITTAGSHECHMTLQ